MTTTATGLIEDSDGREVVVQVVNCARSGAANSVFWLSGGAKGSSS